MRMGRMDIGDRMGIRDRLDIGDRMGMSDRMGVCDRMDMSDRMGMGDRADRLSEQRHRMDASNPQGGMGDER